jgi:uncharacterized C2H2 Zn-finger protein
MVRRIEVAHFCDPCLHGLGKQVPAIFSEVVTVGDYRREIALCMEHRVRFLDDLMLALDAYGLPPSDDWLAAKGIRRQRTAQVCPIPDCLKPCKDRQALASHVRRTHGTSIVTIEAEAAGGTQKWYQCKTCPMSFGSSQQLGAHVYNAHMRTDRKKPVKKSARRSA